MTAVFLTGEVFAGDTFAAAVFTPAVFAPAVLADAAFFTAFSAAFAVVVFAGFFAVVDFAGLFAAVFTGFFAAPSALCSAGAASSGTFSTSAEPFLDDLPVLLLSPRACSPTAESRRTTTHPAPLACVLTGDLDTRPA
ncbi:hypothetical protein ACE1SV_35120 [Streptomyces sp. E-15]